MVITYNLDTKQFTTKPKGAEVGAIRNRLKDNMVTTAPDALIEAIEHGQTFTPGAMKGTTADTWLSQQIFVVDIDNDGPEILEPSKACAILEAYHIKPYCFYYSFSNTEKHPKYRIVVITRDAVTDPKEAEDIKARLTNIFNEACPKCADTSITDNARIIYGSRQNSVFIHDGYIEELATLRTLPEIAREMPENAPTTSSLHDYAENARRANRGNSERFDLLPLLDYIDADDRDTWINVGLCLKYEGYTATDWDNWASKSQKHVPGECFEKWDGLNIIERPVNGGYIMNLAKANGYIPPKDRPDRFLSWDDTLPADADDFEAYRQDDEDPGATDPRTGTPENYIEEPEPEADMDDILAEFWEEIQTERFKPISTGIKSLDYALNGGLERKTLVTLASAPGAGKTAFCQYLFENMARHGHHVIYVNLEMDRSQLLSRSIARIAYEQRHNVKLSSMSWEETAREILLNDVTSTTVRRGYMWTPRQRADIEKALKDYREHIAPRFHYVTTNPENSGHITKDLTQILQKIESIAEGLEAEGLPAPLVCIDYLQYIRNDAPEKMDTAEAIADTLAKLKEYAMKHSTVVMLIMANNRTSNKEGRASMDSGRDTSNIEYTGDTMLSLTYTAIEDRWKAPKYADDGSIEKDKDGNTKYKTIDLDSINARMDICADNDTESALAKKVCIKVVKGRSGPSRRSARFIFDGAHASYMEDPEPPEHGKILNPSNATIEKKSKQ